MKYFVKTKIEGSPTDSIIESKWFEISEFLYLHLNNLMMDYPDFSQNKNSGG